MFLCLTLFTSGFSEPTRTNLSGLSFEHPVAFVHRTLACLSISVFDSLDDASRTNFTASPRKPEVVICAGRSPGEVMVHVRIALLSHVQMPRSKTTRTSGSAFSPPSSLFPWNCPKLLVGRKHAVIQRKTLWSFANSSWWGWTLFLKSENRSFASSGSLASYHAELFTNYPGEFGNEPK